ncbi:MAG TPA: YfhO family protein [Chthoniobacterales bacterium]|nr:YfhO family protein [Chthoniobacterales bacterium]
MKRIGSEQHLDRRECWLAAVFFALIIVCAFPQVVFLGYSLVPTDNYNPLEHLFNDMDYGPNFVPLEEWTKRGIGTTYPNLHDPGGAWWVGEPTLPYFRKAILSGEFPFWDPAAACGVSAYTNLQCQLLFPPQIVLSLLGSTSLQKNAYILFLFWVAGFTTYCLLRRHGLMVLASAAGGLLFLFSGALQQIGPSIFMGQVVACMPVLLLVTKWFIDRPDWRRCAGLAVIYAVVALASFPPILIAAFSFAVCYFVCAIALEKRASWALMVWRFGAAAVLSLGLVAIYYVPAFITVLHTPYITAGYQTAAQIILAPRSIFDLLSPFATGGHMVYSYPIMTADTGHLYYLGATGMLLAGLALGRWQGPARTLLVASALAAALVLLKVFGVPPIQWIAALPVLQSIHYYQYFGILLAFLLSLLAAIGFHRLLTQRPRLQLVLTVCILGIGMRTLWVLARDSGAFRAYASWRWIADYRLTLFFSGAAAVLAVIAMLRPQRRTLATVATGLLLFLVFVEGVANATYPHQRRWDVFAHPPKYVTAMQQLPRPNRSFVAASINANLGSAFGVNSLDSLYMFSPPRMYDLYQKYAISGSFITMREATVLPPEPVLDRAGIDYVLIRQQLPRLFSSVLARQYTVPYQDDYVCLFQRKRTPHYFFSSEYLVTDTASALKLIATEPSLTVLLESQPPFASVANAADDPEPELVSTKLNSLSLRLEAPRAGLLYLAESYYDGWSAKVNGQPTDILLANYAFRAIPVPAGAAHVELSYLPVGFRSGAIVSILSLITVIVLALRQHSWAQS